MQMFEVILLLSFTVRVLMLLLGLPPVPTLLVWIKEVKECYGLTFDHYEQTTHTSDEWRQLFNALLLWCELSWKTDSQDNHRVQCCDMRPQDVHKSLHRMLLTDTLLWKKGLISALM